MTNCCRGIWGDMDIYASSFRGLNKSMKVLVQMFYRFTFYSSGLLQQLSAL